MNKTPIELLLESATARALQLAMKSLHSLGDSQKNLNDLRKLLMGTRDFISSQPEMSHSNEIVADPDKLKVAESLIWDAIAMYMEAMEPDAEMLEEADDEMRSEVGILITNTRAKFAEQRAAALDR